MKKLILIVFMFTISMLKCNASTDVKYYKTIEQNNRTFSYAIDESEYNSILDISLLSSSTQTEYKMMKITQSANSVTLTVQWKKSPKYKSYDIIAVMGDGIKFTNATLDGIQIANTGNDYKYFNYGIASNNTKIFNNGLGISMNLLDNAVSHTLTMNVNYIKEKESAIIYGNYRHAMSNVTLDDSKKYILVNGNIKFNNSNFDSKYDSISSVSISV